MKLESPIDITDHVEKYFQVWGSKVKVKRRNCRWPDRSAIDWSAKIQNRFRFAIF